jgi:hypothetical protein
MAREEAPKMVALVRRLAPPRNETAIPVTRRNCHPNPGLVRCFADIRFSGTGQPRINSLRSFDTSKSTANRGRGSISPECVVHVSVGVRIGLTLIRPLRSSCDSKWTLRVETTRMVPSGHAATERLQSFIGGTKAPFFSIC